MAAPVFDRLGKVGLWTNSFRGGEQHRRQELAAHVEELGFAAVWVPGAGLGLLDDLEVALASTSTTVWATAILNIWAHGAADTASWVSDMRAQFGDRLILGLGASHAEVVSRHGQTYAKPLTNLRAYVDELEKAEPPVPAGMMMLAALGPRMLELAASRTAGAHTYLITPEHTGQARQIMGHGPMLVPELKVVLDDDSTRAREIAREGIALYLGLDNYRRNLKRLGFSEADRKSGGSDRLVDALVAWGDEEAVVERIREHLDAGADHVCVQALGPATARVDQWRRLADALPKDWR